MMKLILASGSPRRRELLSLYTTDFEVCASDFDERAVQAESPAALAEALARGKCLAVSGQNPGCLVVGSDTVVELDGEVFGKPKDADDACRMLRALSGRTHQVHTGVCVSDGTTAESFVDTCKVTFFPIPEEEMERCIASGEPFDKAGAYAIQGQAALWLDRLEGDYYTIMGLPVSRTARLLERVSGKNLAVQR
ncbi:Maf family protein [Faecalibacterium sp. An192]|uniref:Maf family protein n=1 Tax=Faecalibacterium sp. An192 TaxID=1965581 RepID=UPI000B382F24|nr:Maf family protein [Faecalibacterium sp. An192]